MNTIPLIFNQRLISHTLLGGFEKPSKVLMPVACLIINRSGSRYRSFIFDNLVYLGFEDIVCVGPECNDSSLDEISRQYPCVKFVIAREKVTPGDLLNMGMAQTQCPYVLVLQDDLCSESVQFSAPLAKKLIEMNQFCVCPRLFTSSLQSIPVNFIPGSVKSNFTVNTSPSLVENTSTLYACDLAGFYDRDKFIQLGGADYTIESPYWQKLDLFFRAWLWGEKTSIDTSMSFTYSGSIPEEDQTNWDLPYLRFYLKNLLPVYKSDHAEIPPLSFFPFKLRSAVGLSDSLSLFRDARKWTMENKYRFKKDAAALIESWGK